MTLHEIKGLNVTDYTFGHLTIINFIPRSMIARNQKLLKQTGAMKFTSRASAMISGQYIDRAASQQAFVRIMVQRN